MIDAHMLKAVKKIRYDKDITQLTISKLKVALR